MFVDLDCKRIAQSLLTVREFDFCLDEGGSCAGKLPECENCFCGTFRWFRLAFRAKTGNRLSIQTVCFVREIQTLNERMNATRVSEGYCNLGTHLANPVGQMIRITARCLHNNADFRHRREFLSPMKELFHFVLIELELTAGQRSHFSSTICRFLV